MMEKEMTKTKNDPVLKGITLAAEEVYSRIKNIMVQDMFYRTDIGLKWNVDSDKLQTWGYL